MTFDVFVTENTGKSSIERECTLDATLDTVTILLENPDSFLSFTIRPTGLARPL